MQANASKEGKRKDWVLRTGRPSLPSSSSAFAIPHGTETPRSKTKREKAAWWLRAVVWWRDSLLWIEIRSIHIGPNGILTPKHVLDDWMFFVTARWCSASFVPTSAADAGAFSTRWRKKLVSWHSFDEPNGRIFNIFQWIVCDLFLRA